LNILGVSYYKIDFYFLALNDDLFVRYNSYDLKNKLLAITYCCNKTRLILNLMELSNKMDHYFLSIETTKLILIPIQFFLLELCPKVVVWILEKDCERSNLMQMPYCKNTTCNFQANVTPKLSTTFIFRNFLVF
jgi:hypothetical protein